MDIKESLKCPKCKGVYFEIKREATFLYSYKLDTPLTEEWSEEDGALPFLFDYREQINNKEYLECRECGTKYPYKLEDNNPKVHLTILQRAIRSEFEDNPEYLG